MIYLLKIAPKQCLDRRPTLLHTLRGSSVYLFAYWLMVSFVNEYAPMLVMCTLHGLYGHKYK